jgi:pyruvate formate lyase activating enzyme
VPVDCEALARLRTLPQVRENAAAHATNVDLKGFTDEFYRSLCGAQLQPVLDTLVYLVRETQVWTEITTLLIPGRNDSDAEIEAEAQWIARELGPDVPLHFTAFHPDYKLTDIAGTPPATLTRARAIAEAQGLRYVYTGNYSGNVHDAAGGTTSCPGCREPVIVRDWHEIRSYALDPQGRCTRCGAAVPGRYESFARPWGRRRVPIRIGAGAPANE